MDQEIDFGYNSPLDDIGLAKGLCLLQYNGRYISVPNEVWRFHGYKILNWLDNLYDNDVTYIKHKLGETVTIVLPSPIQDAINIEEFLVWIKLTYA